MLYALSSEFQKKYKKANKKIKQKIEEKLLIFSKDPFDTILNNHSLRGDYEGFRSINITGDIRIIYQEVSKDICILIRFGRHSELYDK